MCENRLQFPTLKVQGTTATLSGLTADEVRTIFYALGEYKQNLLETVTTATERFTEGEGTEPLEDEMFCYQEAGTCARLQYFLKDDDQSTRRFTEL